MQRRTWWVGLLAVVVVAGLGGAAYAVWGPVRYSHDLVHPDQVRGMSNRYVNLPDGQAQLAIGSPDRHRIVVQWRDPDGHGWTAPDTVWTAAKGLTAVDSTVRYGGGTVAVVEEFKPDDSANEESDSDLVRAAIVCRERSCVAKRIPGVAGEPQVTPDGRSALLDDEDDQAVVWTARRGIRALAWSGRPANVYDVRSTTPALLAPDGSLRLVSAAATSSGSCTFELYAARPAAARVAASRVASAREPLRGSPRSGCSAYLDTISPDWVATHPDDHRAADFWFVRRSGAWTTTRDDPSGLVVLDRGDDCCSTGIGSFVHWNDVATGSPDGGRHLQLQTHLLGEDRWRAPVRVDGAPRGSTCDSIMGDVMPLGREAAAVALSCRPAGTASGADGASAYVVAVSRDLVHWQSRFVTGVQREPQIEDDVLVVGDTTWSPSAGFGTR